MSINDEIEQLEFERDMHIFCILQEQPGLTYYEANQIAVQEDKEDKL